MRLALARWAGVVWVSVTRWGGESRWVVVRGELRLGAGVWVWVRVAGWLASHVTCAANGFGFQGRSANGPEKQGRPANGPEKQGRPANGHEKQGLANGPAKKGRSPNGLEKQGRSFVSRPSGGRPWIIRPYDSYTALRCKAVRLFLGP